MKNCALALSVAALLFCPKITFAQKATDTRSLSAFENIAISGGFDKIILKQGVAESISLEVDGIDPANITTEVKNNTLEIGTKKGRWNNYKASLVITYKKINEIRNSGSSDIEATSVLKSDYLAFHSSGSGNFKGELDVNKLELAISGSGDMLLRGRADKQEIAISGSADVKAKDLKGTTADVHISGSGDVELNVSGKVQTSVSGSGTVTNQ